MPENYPQSVIATSKAGKREVRVFIDEGRFVRYGYLNVKGKEREKKVKLCLRSKDGNEEHYFMIPVKSGDRFLLIRDKEAKDVKILKEGRAVGLWEE